jgi:hypothetical protein
MWKWELAALVLIPLHLVCSLGHMLWLIWMLDRDRRILETKALPPHDARISKLLDCYNSPKDRRKWFSYYSFFLLVVVFHILYDIFRLIRPLSFDLEEETLSIDYVIMYLISYTMRLSDEFLTYPPLYEWVFNALETRAESFDVLHVGEGWKIVHYALLFILKQLPTIVVILVEASTYLFADYECSGYFVCIYSWDHWFQASVFGGLAWLYFKECFSVYSAKSWIIQIFLTFAPITISLLPFLFLPTLVRITLLLSLYYELFDVSLGIYRLSQHIVLT